MARVWRVLVSSKLLWIEFGASEAIKKRIRVYPRISPKEIPAEFSDQLLHLDQADPLILICWDLYDDKIKHKSYRYRENEAGMNALSRLHTYSLGPNSLLLRKEKVLSTNDTLVNQFSSTLDQKLLANF